MVLRPLRRPQRIEHPDEGRSRNTGSFGQVTHRYDDVGTAGIGSLDDIGTGIAVGAVIDTSPGSGTLLDRDCEAVLHQSLDTVRNESYAVLPRSGFAQQSQAHGSMMLAHQPSLDIHPGR